MLLAVMFIDLDRFKEVNDTLGHAVGDELLLQFTARVRDYLRENDTLARLGGDEFIVLLPELDKLADVILVAERLIELNRKPYLINNESIQIGASIGISLYPEDGTTVQELLNGADIAMYRSKRDGRNQYHLFNPDVAQTA
jgi:diguanylate cyclase (GGDEF)-like protein